MGHTIIALGALRGKRVNKNPQDGTYDTPITSEKRQLEFFCIRTMNISLAYARAPNGLLGMDSTCDDLTDKMFGDLVLQGKLAKLAKLA